MFFGPLHSYGHFVVDTMTSVAASKMSFTPPPLGDWLCQHFSLLNIHWFEILERVHQSSVGPTLVPTPAQRIVA